MTFILGYIHKRAACIIADSAETITNEAISGKWPVPEVLESSLGEIPFLEDGRVVYEAANKIIKFKNEVLITFSGSVSIGEKITRELIYELEKPFRKSDIILTFFFKKYTDLTKNEFIVAFTEDNRPKIVFCYIKSKPLLIENDGQIVVAGAPSNVLLESFQQSLDFSQKENYSCMETLIFSVSTIQKISQSFSQLESGIGGFFNGAFVKSNRIYWAEDTLHTYFSGVNFFQGDMLTMARVNRNGCVYILCNRFRRVFRDTISLLSEDCSKGKVLVDKQFKELDFKFFVFISYDTNRIVLINNRRPINRVVVRKGEMYLVPRITNWMFSKLFKNFDYQHDVFCNFYPATIGNRIKYYFERMFRLRFKKAIRKTSKDQD